MPFRVTNRQLALEPETDEGVDAFGGGAPQADQVVEVLELGSDYRPDTLEPRPVVDHLAGEAVRIANRQGIIRGSTLFRPNPTLTEIPPHDSLLRACGHERLPVTLTTMLGGQTPNLLPGERINGDRGSWGFFIERFGNDMRWLRGSEYHPPAEETLTGLLTAETYQVTVDALYASSDVAWGYRPVSRPVAWSAQENLDGKRLALRGARGRGSVDAIGVGSLPRLRFDLLGAADPVDDFALFPRQLEDLEVRPFLDANMLIKGFVPVCCTQLRLNFGLQLEPKGCASSAGGIVAYRVTDRRPVIEIDPEEEPEAFAGFYEDLDAEVEVRFAAKLGYGGARRSRIDAPRCQYVRHAREQRAGLGALRSAIRPLRQDLELGDDEYIITHE